MDTAPDEYRSDRTGKLDPRESTPLDRPRFGHTRIHPAPSTSGATESEGVVQPSLASTSLHVEIYPERRESEIRGTHVLANTSSVAIDSIHVATVPGVET